MSTALTMKSKSKMLASRREQLMAQQEEEVDEINEAKNDILVLCDLVEQYKSQVNQLQSDVLCLSEEVVRVEEENIALRSAVEEKNAFIANLEDEVANLQVALQQKSKENSELESQLDAVDGSQLKREQALQVQKNELQATVEEQSRIIEEYEDQINSQQTDLLDLAARLRTLEAQQAANRPNESPSIVGNITYDRNDAKSSIMTPRPESKPSPLPVATPINHLGQPISLNGYNSSGSTGSGKSSNAWRNERKHERLFERVTISMNNEPTITSANELRHPLRLPPLDESEHLRTPTQISSADHHCISTDESYGPTNDSGGRSQQLAQSRAKRITVSPRQHDGQQLLTVDATGIRYNNFNSNMQPAGRAALAFRKPQTISPASSAISDGSTPTNHGQTRSRSNSTSSSSSSSSDSSTEDSSPSGHHLNRGMDGDEISVGPDKVRIRPPRPNSRESIGSGLSPSINGESSAQLSFHRATEPDIAKDIAKDVFWAAPRDESDNNSVHSADYPGTNSRHNVSGTGGNRGYASDSFVISSDNDGSDNETKTSRPPPRQPFIPLTKARSTPSPSSNSSVGAAGPTRGIALQQPAQPPPSQLLLSAAGRHLASLRQSQGQQPAIPGMLSNNEKNVMSQQGPQRAPRSRSLVPTLVAHEGIDFDLSLGDE